MIGGVLGVAVEASINKFFCTKNNYHCRSYAAFAHHVLVEPLIDNILLPGILSQYLGYDNKENLLKCSGKIICSIAFSCFANILYDNYLLSPVAGIVGGLSFDFTAEILELSGALAETLQ